MITNDNKGTYLVKNGQKHDKGPFINYVITLGYLVGKKMITNDNLGYLLTA